MFIGHFAVGFAAKRVAPRLSLGTLFLAPLWLDVIWPVFLSTGLETVRIDPGNTVVTPLDLHDYPYSHSLLMAIVWSVLFGAVVAVVVRELQSALVAAGAVFSHWVLDFVTHRPDMPLYPGSTHYVGLGLWNSLVGTLLVEVTLFVLGVFVYVKTTRPKNRKGGVLLWSLVAVLSLVYVSAIFGPPPPDERALAVTAFGVLLFLAWGYWLDRNRAVART